MLQIRSRDFWTLISRAAAVCTEICRFINNFAYARRIVEPSAPTRLEDPQLGFYMINLDQNSTWAKLQFHIPLFNEKSLIFFVT